MYITRLGAFFPPQDLGKNVPETWISLYVQSKNHLSLNSGGEGAVEILNFIVSTASYVFSVFHVEALFVITSIQAQTPCNFNGPRGLYWKKRIWAGCWRNGDFFFFGWQREWRLLLNPSDQHQFYFFLAQLQNKHSSHCSFTLLFSPTLLPSPGESNKPSPRNDSPPLQGSLSKT